jgi:hypothetical protein
MTAAAAIAHVGLCAVDPTLLQRAVDWSRRGTIPILRFLPTFIACCGALLDDDVLEAADLAERYWHEAAPVPSDIGERTRGIAGDKKSRVARGDTLTCGAGELVFVWPVGAGGCRG